MDLTLAAFADGVGRLMPRMLRGLLAREQNALSQGRLTVPQLSILDYVAGAGHCTMGAIAAVFNMKPPTVTGTVDRLVKMGLLRRGHAETDRRTVVAAATPKGRRILAGYHGERRRTVAQMFDGVTPPDRTRFLRTMRLAVERIEVVPTVRAAGVTRRGRAGSLAIAAGLLSWAAAAVEPGSNAVHRYSLEACLRRGLERSVAVQNAGRDRATAEAIIGQTRAQILPELKAKADYLRRDELDAFDFGGERMEFGRLDNYNGSLGVSQLLYNGGSVQAALRAAKSYRDRTERAEARIRETLVRDITVAFHTVLFLEEAVRVQSDAVEQLRKFADQAEEKFRKGATAEFDALSARVRLANEMPPLAAARRELGVARAAFRNLARLDEESYALDGALAYTRVDVDSAAARADGLRERHELEEQRKTVELREADVRVEKGGYAPTVRVHGSYLGKNPESFAATEAGWDWGWQAGLTVEWNLFDGLLRESRLQEKALALATARADYEELERTIAVEVEQACLQLGEAAEAVESSRQTVALAEKNLEIAKARFDAGLSTYLEFTDTNLAVRRARLQWSAALRDHLSASARLAYATGKTRMPALEEEP
ncbi:MAG: hypothetical protein BWK77_02620, partial [Verrucomicrobia bacterium A1]